MKTITFRMNDLLRKIESRDFLIPQFQRPFKWMDSQVKLLVDSISRNYPVGSLLVLSKNPELPLSARALDAVINHGWELEQEDAMVDNEEGKLG